MEAQTANRSDPMGNPTPVVAEEIPPDEASALLDKLADGLVKRRLTTPAVLALETCKPLNFIGSQFMIALNPFVSAFFDTTDYRKIALLLENDAHLEALLVRIEARESEFQRDEAMRRSERATPGRWGALLNRFRRRRD